MHSKVLPTRYNVTQFFISRNCSICFGWILQPSSGAPHCIYSIWYLSNRYCYLPLVDTVWCSWWWLEDPHVEHFTEIKKKLYKVAYCCILWNEMLVNFISTVLNQYCMCNVLLCFIHARTALHNDNRPNVLYSSSVCFLPETCDRL